MNGVTESKEIYVEFVAGDPELSLRGPTCITVTPTSLEFAPAYFSLFKSQKPIRFPLAKIKGISIMPRREISAFTVWIAGPVLGSALKDEKNLLVIQYEKEDGLTETLVFKPSQQDIHDKQKIRFIRSVRSALSSLKKTVGQKCPLCGKAVSADFVLCPYCGKELKH